MTVRDYIAGNYDKRRPVYIDTHCGRLEVTGIRWPETNPWIVTG